MLRKLYFRLSPEGRRLARRIYYLTKDIICRLFSKQTVKKSELLLQNQFDGWWRTGCRQNSVNFQDIMIFKKE